MSRTPLSAAPRTVWDEDPNYVTNVFTNHWKDEVHVYARFDDQSYVFAFRLMPFECPDLLRVRIGNVLAGKPCADTEQILKKEFAGFANNA